MSPSFFSAIQFRFTDFLSSEEGQQIKDKILDAFKGAAAVQVVSSLALGAGVGKFAVCSANSPVKTGIAVLSALGGTLFLLADKIHARSSVVFAFFTLGLLLGGRPVDKKIEDLLEERWPVHRLEQGQVQTILVLQPEDVKAFDLTRLSGAICKKFADNDSLQTLSLANCNLMDQELEEMATAGCFAHVRELDLSNNPQLTGKSIAYLAKLEKLERLTLDGNPNVVHVDLEKWVECRGFKHLKAISLADTKIDEDLLGTLTRDAPWVSNLEGINLSYNPTLLRFPLTIAFLDSLQQHGVSAQDLKDKKLLFSGKGIWCLQKRFRIEPTKEIVDLAAAGKVHGVLVTKWNDDQTPAEFFSMTYLLKSMQNRNASIEEVYKVCGLSV